jgi:hypothetical protein
MSHEPHPQGGSDPLSAIRAREAKATLGPWQIIEKRYDDDGSGKGICGKVAERRIATVWHHGQLRGPVGVVNGATTIWPVEGMKPRHLVRIEEADAEFIAHAREDIPALLALYEAALARIAALEATQEQPTIGRDA